MKDTKDSTASVLVDRESFYYPITKDTPRGQKCILINRAAGVGVLGELSRSNESFFTHYSPMPTFRD